jgi:hypothetical protein
MYSRHLQARLDAIPTDRADQTMIELTESWSDWRQGVVAVIRNEFRDIFDQIDDGDIDWDAWRPLFDEGRSPQAAVDRAFVRNL